MYLFNGALRDEKFGKPELTRAFQRSASPFGQLTRISHRKTHHMPVVSLFRQKDCMYLFNGALRDEKFGKPELTRAFQRSASPFGQLTETARDTPLRVDLPDRIEWSC
jgi:hypothetical protein